MSKIIFTSEQIAKLRKNVNVTTCSERSITWSQQFKLQAVRLYQQGMAAREIFRQAGFELSVIGRNKPKDCLKCWNKIYRTKGEFGLSQERRGATGRPKKILDASAADKIKRLEAEVAYLKKENHFLTKLRKKSLN